MTPERIAHLVTHHPIINDLAHLRMWWAWTDTGRPDLRANPETEVADADIEKRAVVLVRELRGEGWSSIQRGQILARAVTRAAWAMRPAAQEAFYSGFRQKRVRFSGVRKAMLGLSGDWRSWRGGVE